MTKESRKSISHAKESADILVPPLSSPGIPFLLFSSPIFFLSLETTLKIKAEERGRRKGLSCLGSCSHFLPSPFPPAREKTDVTSFKKTRFFGRRRLPPHFPLFFCLLSPLLHIERVRPLNYEITHAELRRRRRDRPAQGDGRTGGRKNPRSWGGNLRES